MIRIPTNVSVEIQQVLRDLNNELNKIIGARNADFKGRRIINAGNAVDPTDYATVLDVRKLIDTVLAVRDAAAARKSAQAASVIGGAGSGSGGGGGGIQAPNPLVALYDGLSIVEAYAVAQPAQLANSCQDTGGTWDFMDGVVAALRAADDRFGYNGKRGNVADPSKDAVSYYHGEYSLMNVGSNSVYVVDIISGHCGSSPGPAFQDVTIPGVLGAWLPTR